MNPRTKSRKKLGAKKGQRRFIHSNLSIVILVILTIAFGRQLFGAVGKYRLSEEKLSETILRLEQKEKEEEVLRAKIEALDTPEGKERAIRERFNVTKENEGVIYVIEPEDVFEEEISLEEEGVDNKNFIQNILYSIGL